MSMTMVGQISLMRMGRVVVAVALVAAAWRFVCFSAAKYVGRYPPMPEVIANIETFNNVSGFEQDAGNPRRFKFCKGNVMMDGNGYLRFAIPDFDPSPYQLRLKLKARHELLKAARVRTARDVRHGGDVNGDIATFDIPMKDSTPFVWSDGKCYVGVTFPKSSLKPNDMVELVDFKFEVFK